MHAANDYDYATVWVVAVDGSVEHEHTISREDAAKVFAAGSWIPEWKCTRAEYESVIAFPVDERNQQTGPAVVMSSADYIATWKAGNRLGQRPRVLCGGRKAEK